MANLFEKKAPVKSATAKKDDKVSVAVAGSEFAKKLKAFKEMKVQMNNLKANLADVQAEILSVGKEEWYKLYQSMMRNPESFRLKSDDGEAILIMPKDQCLSIGEDRAKELQEKYGDSIVTEETTFSFNPEILNLHGEKLSALIQSAKFLTDAEKDALVVPTTTVSVKKGAINEVFTTGKGNVEEFLSDIQPIVAIK
jgi:hypothetical protein